jgi:translocation and assembly module TamA
MNKTAFSEPATWLAAPAMACLLSWSMSANAELVFSGLDAPQETNARALVSLASSKCDTNRWRVRRLFQDAEGQLRQALQALGYYRIEIDKRITWTEECWRAEIDVITGEPVRYRLVDLKLGSTALQDTDLAGLATDDRPAIGEILNHGQYERYKTAMLRRLSSQGYFEADFARSEVIVDPASLSADLYLHLNSGPRYRFGDISFTPGILRTDLLLNYTDIEEGDYYDSAAISELYESLNGSGYFNSVSIRTDAVDESTSTAPVEVSLTPGIRRNYSIGAGFSTDTGPQGRLGYINRRRNDRGHQFEARAFVSDTDSELTGTYRWPFHDPRTDWMSVIGGVQHEDTDTSENDTFKLGILRIRSLSKDWIWTRYANYTYEDYSIAGQDETSQLVILGVNFESAIGREISRSERGHRINLDLRGASDSLGSDTSFLQLTATAKWLRSLSDKTRIIMRGQLGATLKESLTELPVSVRFFTGGDRSVRGYDFESLGPVDINGVIIGGGSLLEASFEIDRVIARNWSIAAFVDTGSAFNDFDPKFSTGVGIGIRWYSPVGPVRLDFAHPLDDPDRDFRLHISLGPDL